MMPSLIAAGHISTEYGFPLVARCDMFWPEHQESTSADQYMFLNDTLVAPIWDAVQNETARSVWIPPGSWQDVWDGRYYDMHA